MLNLIKKSIAIPLENIVNDFNKISNDYRILLKEKTLLKKICLKKPKKKMRKVHSGSLRRFL